MNAKQASEDRFAHYLMFMKWLRKRYTKNGTLVLSVGGVYGPYLRLETLAFERYLNV